MLDIYLAPSRAFARLKEKPLWLVPLVLIVVTNMVVALLSARYVDWSEQREKIIDSMRERNVPEDQINQRMEAIDKFQTNPLMRYGAPPLGALFTTVIYVLFLVIIYNVCLPLLGAGGNFVRALSVVANAGLVAIPGAVIRVVLLLLKRSAGVSTSLAAVFPSLKNGFLTIILGRIDPFAIWQLVLAGLGLKVIFDLKGSKSYWLVFSVWGLLTLIFALLGARSAR